jgi:hypothetical protein
MLLLLLLCGGWAGLSFHPCRQCLVQSMDTFLGSAEQC